MDRVGLQDGMLVSVRVTAVAEHGQVVAVRLPDESFTVKRLVLSPELGAWLVPESSDPKWEPRPLQEGDQVVGVVEGIPRRDLTRQLARHVRRQVLHPDHPQRRRGWKLWLERVHYRRAVESLKAAPPPTDPPQRQRPQQDAFWPPMDPPAWRPTTPWARNHWGEAPMWGGEWRRVNRERSTRLTYSLPWAGELGPGCDVDPASKQRILLSHMAAGWSQFCVMQDGEGLAGRGLHDGDLLYVARIRPQHWESGLIAVVRLGDMGTIAGELHGDRRRLWIRSRSGQPGATEWGHEIDARDVLGFVGFAEC